MIPGLYEQHLTVSQTRKLLIEDRNEHIVRSVGLHTSARSVDVNALYHVAEMMEHFMVLIRSIAFYGAESLGEY